MGVHTSVPKEEAQKDKDSGGLNLQKIYEKLTEASKEQKIAIGIPHGWPKTEDGYDYVGGKSLPYEATLKVKLGKTTFTDPWEGQDVSQYHYEEYAKSISYASSDGQLIGLHNKLGGLHGPLASKLMSLIEEKSKELKKQKQLDQWYANQQLKKQKNHELDSWSDFQQVSIGGIKSSTDTHSKLYGMWQTDPYKNATIGFIKVKPVDPLEMEEKKEVKFNSEHFYHWEKEVKEETKVEMKDEI